MRFVFLAGLFYPLFSLARLTPHILDADDLTSEYICKDSIYYLDRRLAGPFTKSKVACPSGYHLAKLADVATFNHAAIFLFSCLGPSSDAWIGQAMGTVYAEGDPVKLTTPDAIEKGGAIPQRNKSGHRYTANRPTRHTKHNHNHDRYLHEVGNVFEKNAPTEVPHKVRTMANVFLDNPDAVLPFLCQLDYC